MCCSTVWIHHIYLHLLVDTWVVSSLGLLRMKPPRTLVHRLLLVSALLSLGKCLGGVVWRSCFHSGCAVLHSHQQCVSRATFRGWLAGGDGCLRFLRTPDDQHLFVGSFAVPLSSLLRCVFRVCPPFCGEGLGCENNFLMEREYPLLPPG